MNDKGLMKIVRERRLGQVRMSLELLEDLQQAKIGNQYETICTEFWGKIFIVDADVDYVQRIVTYKAYSKEFDVAEDLKNPPEYNFSINKSIIEPEPIYNFSLTIRKA